jgi:hypothetical protein
VPAREARTTADPQLTTCRQPHDGAVEIYDRRRFFTSTGLPLSTAAAQQVRR